MYLTEYLEKRWSKHPGYSTAELKKMDIVLKMIGSGKTVLDVGSFDGTIAQKIEQSGNRVVSVDVSFAALQNAKKRVSNVVQISPFSEYPFRDQTFDIVFFGEVLEHIMDTDSILLELKRILKNNGSLIVTTPNVASLPRRLLLLFGKNPFLEFSLNPQRSVPGIGHIRYFTKATLFELLEANGFDVEDFTSDAVNFFKGGRGCSTFLARLFPFFGKSLIVKCRKSAQKNKRRS